MAEDAIISARGLGKRYVIGHRSAERVPTLRDAIVRNTKGFLQTGGDILRGKPLVSGDTREEFWALKDVDFDIRRGDVVGIIGRNGAGKSTLLKILSRITEPSEGRVEIYGRVASLLEVGTGFHPELTGRENIFLNGAVLGMTQAEIRKKFDEIVAFAEVEKFLDTPVKRYSSGMYVRLAFAVAAHLEPEILIVDEVLAVGDAEFQKKCLGKMQDVAGHGRTVLFVSHNMPAIKALCGKGIFLANGMVEATGPVEFALQRYLMGRADAECRGRQVFARAGVSVDQPEGTIRLTFEITLSGPLSEPHLGIGIHDTAGTRICTVLTETAAVLPSIEAGQKAFIRVTTEPVRLSPGTLTVKVDLANAGAVLESHPDAIRILIPDYTPFARQPHVRPNGLILVTHSMEIAVDTLEAHFDVA